ncbi:hypothetical protein IFR05_011947 [Cadophora sp. M221]|nr:hypothetical protein IFR05_011947 [Cadophora sp. M221]
MAATTMQQVAEVEVGADTAWLEEEPWPETLFDDRADEQETVEGTEEPKLHQPPRRQPFRRLCTSDIHPPGRVLDELADRVILDGFIRCDAGSHGIPCTNCTAHSVTCFIPPKKKKTSDRVAVGEMSRYEFNTSLSRSPTMHAWVLTRRFSKHRGRYKPAKPWLEPSPVQVSADEPEEPTPPPENAKLQIEDNLRSLEDKTIFTGLYAAIAQQNNTTCFSRKESIDMRAECIQNISQRISSEYRVTDRKNQDEWVPVLAFYEEDEDRRAWMDKEVPVTPGATGLDVEEW